MEKTLIFIPCLNAEKTISQVIDKVKKLNFPNDILIIDNHSSDNTVNTITMKKQNEKLPNITILVNSKNIGYGGSQIRALNYAIKNNYRYLIVVHSDDQYPAEYSPHLLDAIKKERSSMVVGCRLGHPTVKKNMPAWRYLGNSLLSAFNRWAYGLRLNEFYSEFRIYDVSFMKNIDFSRWAEGELFTMRSIIGILHVHGKITDISIPCSYHKDAHHPPMFELLLYVLFTFYRGLIYKLFRR